MTRRQAAIGEALLEARPFPELMTSYSDPALEIIKVTDDDRQFSHTSGIGDQCFRMFTKDSSRMVFSRETAAGRQYWLCELEDQLKIRRLTDVGARSAVLNADDSFLYYFVDQVDRSPVRILLQRISLRDFRTETVQVFDTKINGVGRMPIGGTRFGNLSGDGRTLASGFSFATKGDERGYYAPIFIDLDTFKIWGFDWEWYCWRVGGSYYMGSDPDKSHHLLMSKFHRDQFVSDGPGWKDDIHRVTMHVVNDQGEMIGTIPMGGEGEGVDHAGWRGGRYEVVMHSVLIQPNTHFRMGIVGATPVACPPEQVYDGNKIVGGQRYEMTRKIFRPECCHMSWNMAGNHLVSNTEGYDKLYNTYLWLGTVMEKDGNDPEIIPKHLLHTKTSWTQYNYWCVDSPALSPDERTVFFNSDYLSKPGHPQLCCVRGFSFPK